MTREMRHAQVKALKEEQGLSFREIARHLGLARSTVTAAYYDPTGNRDRARREKYTGSCVNCGGRTNSGGGIGSGPERCSECANPRWSRESILLAIQEWGDEHGGVPPREVDTRTGHEGHGKLPHETSVRKHFGSWNAALLAGGFAIRCDRRQGTQEAIEAAVRAGESTASIANRYGVTPQAIHRRLRYRGLSVRGLREAA